MKTKGKPQKAKGRKSGALEGTVDGWASALGRDRRTIEKGLVKVGLRFEPLRVYSAREIFSAMFGDKHAAEVRNLELDAREKEREEKIALCELVRMPEVEQSILERLVIPLTENLEGMATACSQLANPADPTTAHAVIDGYLERTLKPYLRSKLNL